MDIKIKENIEKYFSLMGDQMFSTYDNKSDSEFFDDQTSVVRTQFSNHDLLEE
jgi:hypothetical protein